MYVRREKIISKFCKLEREIFSYLLKFFIENIFAFNFG